MSFSYRAAAAGLILAVACLTDLPREARAHGVAGPRFFPANETQLLRVASGFHPM